MDFGDLRHEFWLQAQEMGSIDPSVPLPLSQQRWLGVLMVLQVLRFVKKQNETIPNTSNIPRRSRVMLMLLSAGRGLFLDGVIVAIADKTGAGLYFIL